MDRKSKVLVLVLMLIMILSAVATFYKTVVLQDYELKSEVK